MINFRIIINISSDRFQRIVLDSILKLNLVEPYEIILAPTLGELLHYLSKPLDLLYEVFPGFNYGLILCRDPNDSVVEHQRLEEYMLMIVNEVKKSEFYNDFLNKTIPWEDPWFINNYNSELNDYQRVLSSVLNDQSIELNDPEPLPDLSGSRVCLFSQQQRIKHLNQEIAGISFSIGMSLGLALGAASIPCFLFGPLGIGIALASLAGAAIIFGAIYAIIELADHSADRVEMHTVSL